MNVSSLLTNLLAGDRRSVAKAITAVENGDAGSVELLSSLYSATGRAYRIGITGPPGAGKSTLTNKLARYYRGQGCRIGIIAVDPTSPFSGGALLGDRVRMTDVDLDEGVFIRSMASRGSLGGLSRKANEAADVLDAAGFDLILMETVGVGQSELDIAGSADTTIVVLVPESGDGIQAMKAGLMEIADFFVLNKADRPGADQAVQSIKMILGLRPHDESTWMPDVLKTQANDGIGIAGVAETVTAHKTHLQKSGRLDEKRRQRMKDRMRDLINERRHIDFWTSERNQMLEEAVESVFQRTISPYAVVDNFLKSNLRT